MMRLGIGALLKNKKSTTERGNMAESIEHAIPETEIDLIMSDWAEEAMAGDLEYNEQEMDWSEYGKEMATEKTIERHRYPSWNNI